MALPEVCSVWIEQRIEEEMDTGKSLREIGRIIAQEVEKHFEVKVAPTTISMRASRSKTVTNVTQEETDEESTPSEEIKQIKRAKDGTLRGGRREGAGRKPQPSQADETRE